MRKISIKVLSVFLSLILAVSTVICVPVSAGNEPEGTDIPLIYVCGQGSALYKYDENGVKQTVYPIEIPDGFIESAVKENIGIFAKAVITQKWEEFGQAFRGIMDELYGPLALDENGEPKDGSFCYNEWHSQWVDPNPVNGKYPTERYTFFYDFRLDPYKLADDLHGYIEKVMAATGADHVALLGRCLGGCVVAAYMKKYDGEYVSDMIQYCTAVKGATVCSKLLSGDYYLDADAIERLVYDYQLSAEQVTNDLIQSFVTLFNKTYGLDIACWSVNNVWDNIYLDILPDMLLDTFGTWPGFWSMINDEDYNRAKDTIFHNADKDKWANFIDIIDNYHYNVQTKVEEDFVRYAENGIDIYNVSKYGYQAIPVNAPGDLISDSTCALAEASIGATVTSLFTSFDDSYVEKAKADGTYKYISPDRQVDASTCLFPERTWVIKNLDHKNFPKSVNTLFDLMVNTDGFDINTDERFPQFMVHNDGNVTPMTGENQNTYGRYHHTFRDALKVFVKALNTLISNSLKSKAA